MRCKKERDWGPFSVFLPGRYFSRLLLLLIVAVHTKEMSGRLKPASAGGEVLNPGGEHGGDGRCRRFTPAVS